jgi:hypothetical protein
VTAKFTQQEVQAAIARECDALRDMLLAKNEAYGNSALDPLRIFSRAEPDELIRVRLDDKLSRIARGQAAGEDVEQDLIGYLVLLRVYRGLVAAHAMVARAYLGGDRAPLPAG